MAGTAAVFYADPAWTDVGHAANKAHQDTCSPLTAKARKSICSFLHLDPGWNCSWTCLGVFCLCAETISEGREVLQTHLLALDKEVKLMHLVT